MGQRTTFLLKPLPFSTPSTVIYFRAEQDVALYNINQSNIIMTKRPEIVIYFYKNILMQLPVVLAMHNHVSQTSLLCIYIEQVSSMEAAMFFRSMDCPEGQKALRGIQCCWCCCHSFLNLDTYRLL